MTKTPTAAQTPLPPFELRYGTIPKQMLKVQGDGFGPYTGWWLSGTDGHDLTDVGYSCPFLLVSEGPAEEHLYEAKKKMAEPAIEHVATHLMGQTVAVTGWTKQESETGAPPAYRPNLKIVQHRITLVMGDDEQVLEHLTGAQADTMIQQLHDVSAVISADVEPETGANQCRIHIPVRHVTGIMHEVFEQDLTTEDPAPGGGA